MPEPTLSRPAAYDDQVVLDAQKRNIDRMHDAKLLREFWVVTGFPEQPPIRVAYVNQMRDEIARRGLSEPS